MLVDVNILILLLGNCLSTAKVLITLHISMAFYRMDFFTFLFLYSRE